MAKDWKTAQIKEKEFWKNIYLTEAKDDVYRKTASKGWKDFAEEILSRNNIEKQFLNNKVILDLGSGPAGVAKGIHEMIKNNEIQNCNVIATDPLMEFYKNDIGILKEDENLKLFSDKGETLNLKDNSVDIIISTNVLDHCEDVDRLISEAYRVLKPNGFFFPSVHLVYNYLTPLSSLIKYFDTNHPNHFTNFKLVKKLQLKFSKIETVNIYSIKHDQKNFTFINIFKSKNFLRSVKRFISNYILYTSYFKCKKH
jgi:ubiquinone/menaquinone biosynthesis C-methylase UbiE